VCQGEFLVLLLHAGSGKTLAFLLPLVIHAKLAALRGAEGVKALVVSPTRELAVQSGQVCAACWVLLRPHDLHVQLHTPNAIQFNTHHPAQT
jgi:hypothetical protein